MDCTVSPAVGQPLRLSRPTSTVDVTIVGAGPAGALLAYLLSTCGLRVVLIDKARLPRVKPCGGGLNHKTVDLLPFAIQPVVERVVSRLVFTQKLRLPFARTSPTPLVTLVTRCRFDHFLVEHAAAAGARVIDACRVTRIESEARRYTLRAEGLTLHSRFLAFADGAKGTLRRQVGFAATAPHDLGLDLDVDAGPACPWTPETLYIDWGSRPQCYAWAFPKADHWSIGVKGPAHQSRPLVDYLRRFMQYWGLAPTTGKLGYLAHMLPTRAPNMPLVHGRALVLGDAAGLLEPFTGEGIYYAVRSAHLAAEALCDACKHDMPPRTYAQAVEAEIMPELGGARALQTLFDAYPQPFHLLVRAYPRFWRALAKILRGDRGFADVDRILRRHPYVVQGLLALRGIRPQATR